MSTEVVELDEFNDLENRVEDLELAVDDIEGLELDLERLENLFFKLLIKLDIKKLDLDDK